MLKFVEKDDVFYEVGLAKWIITLSTKTQKGKTYWPPKDNLVTSYVTREISADKTTWKICAMELKRRYCEFLQ